MAVFQEKFKSSKAKAAERPKHLGRRPKDDRSEPPGAAKMKAAMHKVSEPKSQAAKEGVKQGGKFGSISMKRGQAKTKRVKQNLGKK